MSRANIVSLLIQKNIITETKDINKFLNERNANFRILLKDGRLVIVDAVIEKIEIINVKDSR